MSTIEVYIQNLGIIIMHYRTQAIESNSLYWCYILETDTATALSAWRGSLQAWPPPSTTGTLSSTSGS